MPSLEDLIASYRMMAAELEQSAYLMEARAFRLSSNGVDVSEFWITFNREKAAELRAIADRAETELS